METHREPVPLQTMLASLQRALQGKGMLKYPTRKPRALAGLLAFPWSAVSGNNPDWKSQMPREFHWLPHQKRQVTSFTLLGFSQWRCVFFWKRRCNLPVFLLSQSFLVLLFFFSLFFPSLFCFSLPCLASPRPAPPPPPFALFPCPCLFDFLTVATSWL